MIALVLASLLIVTEGGSLYGEIEADEVQVTKSQAAWPTVKSKARKSRKPTAVAPKILPTPCWDANSAQVVLGGCAGPDVCQDDTRMGSTVFTNHERQYV